MAWAFLGGDANGGVGAVRLFLSLSFLGEEDEGDGGAIRASMYSDNSACCSYIALMYAWPHGHVAAAKQRFEECSGSCSSEFALPARHSDTHRNPSSSHTRYAIQTRSANDQIRANTVPVIPYRASFPMTPHTSPPQKLP